MRSRYTAFAVGDADHLVRTWHPRTRPEEIDLDDTVWEGLVIDEAVEDGDAATVAFRASWGRDGERGVLSERSRFARRGGRWVYVPSSPAGVSDGMRRLAERHPMRGHA